MGFSRKKSTLPELVEKVQLSVPRVTVPGHPRLGGCSDTQAPRASEKPAGLKFSGLREIHIT